MRGKKPAAHIHRNFRTMITFLAGAIAFKSPTHLVVETGGIGYHINISLHTYAKVEKLDSVKLFTYYHVNQQDYIPALFGFAEEFEKMIFVHLISVSGVSVNSARVILSSMSPEEVRGAVVGENEAAFRKVKGIGIKTAKQIILDLKDKLVKEGGDVPVEFSAQNNTKREEALSALVALQIPKIQAQKALNHVLKENPATDSVEVLIKMALKHLG